MGVGGGEFTLFRKKLLSLDQLKAASTREKLDTGIVFLALLVWPKGEFLRMYNSEGSVLLTSYLASQGFGMFTRTCLASGRKCLEIKFNIPLIVVFTVFDLGDVPKPKMKCFLHAELGFYIHLFTYGVLLTPTDRNYCFSSRIVYNEVAT